MTTEQKEMVKATVPYLREHGVALTTHFYKRLFEFNPDLKNVFNMGNQQNSKQQTALAMAVLAYAENIDHPEVLLAVLDGIGQKHISLNIRAEHYLIVGEHLLASIGEVLGEGATEDLLKSWEAAYFQLADIMSGHELELYRQQVQKKGGWTGWRPFIVKDKVRESSEITSFYLYPTDGGKIADFAPGQYISVRLFLPELNLLQPRQYSISTAPNGIYYRISVKKETSTHPTPDGMISNRLHDFVSEGQLVDVSAPAGSFTLKDGVHPIVFISGGVGQTPLISMMESLINSGSERKQTWIHGCRDQNVHAFREMIELWATEHDHLERHVFYSTTGHELNKEGHYEGWVDLNRFRTEVQITADTEYYLCGPAGFIEKNLRDLVKLGADRSRIYFEEFGPQTLHLN
nr:NO-inducible flavohemoprotein [Mucilaginibacter sp. L294]